MRDLQIQIIGLMPLSRFIAAMIFALIGFTIQKKIDLNKAKKKLTEAPSTLYWIKDNWDDMLINFLVTFLLVRFGPELVNLISPEALSFFTDTSGMLMYLVLGFFQTLLVRRIKNRLKSIK